MHVSLYRWYGDFGVASGVYDRDEVEGDEEPHAYLEIRRGRDYVDVWVYGIEEVDALMGALQEIKDHLEAQAQEAA